MKIAVKPQRARYGIVDHSGTLRFQEQEGTTLQIHLKEEPMLGRYSPKVLRFSIDINSFSPGFSGPSICL